jgi:2-methylcitrate dehydratase PrpD
MGKECSRCNCAIDEEFNQMTPEKRPSNVTIKFSDDSYEILEETTYYPLGEVENPLKEEDILDKFKLLNPKFNMNKLQIIKHMEDYSISEIFEELGL